MKQSNIWCILFLYFVNAQVTAEVNCCHNSPELTIPITVGSIPFIENYHRLKRRGTVVGMDDKKKIPPMPILPSDLLADSMF